jgi:hypothetical protein
MERIPLVRNLLDGGEIWAIFERSSSRGTRADEDLLPDQ